MPKFARHHYEVIAETAKEAYEQHGQNRSECAALYIFLWNLSHELKRDNPDFDRDRFMAATGMED